MIRRAKIQFSGYACKGLKLPLLAVAALHLALPSASLAAQTTSASPQVHSRVDDLVNLIIAPELQGQQARAQADNAFMRTADTDPNFQKMEQRKPGFVAALRKALHDAMQDQIPTMVAAMSKTMGDFFRSNFTESEIQTLLDFYNTPTGTRMLASARQGALVQVGNATSDHKIDSNDMQNISNHAAAGAAHAIEAGDIEALTIFGQTTAAQKMAKVQGDLNSILLQAINSEIARMQPLINSRLETTFKTYTAKH